MQKLHSTNDELVSPEQCAEQLLEVVPAVMRRIKLLMREGRSEDLSVPQFRALGYIHRHPDATLSAVAEHVGLSDPATSRLVDHLVRLKLIERGVSSSDRRQVALRLSEPGRDLLERTRQRALGELAAIIGVLSESERSDIVRALRPLRETFGARDAEAAVAEESAERTAPLKGRS